MSNKYDASAIQVLSGLDPVRKRPGMYTQTERPNHLVQEVVDNSVDEALAGYASHIVVTLQKDGFVSVSDDGRGMPVDIHPEEKVSGVEVILTKLHAGGKFSNKNYSFSGGLHGVGVSVVNALSTTLIVEVKRDGALHRMEFKDGIPMAPLDVVDKVGQRNTGTTILFTPDPQFFDSAKISVKQLKRSLKAKAILCDGLKIEFRDENDSSNDDSWLYQDGFIAYLLEALGQRERLPEDPLVGNFSEDQFQVDWGLVWCPEGEAFAESYVNLIPTAQGGTHVNGLRAGITDAIREFCDFRELLPRGVKLSPEDCWQNVSFLLSVRQLDPQFAGQTKERLSSKETATKVMGAVKDHLSLWLNQHLSEGEAIAQLCIVNAQSRLKQAKQVTRKKISSGPALPGKLADCTSEDLGITELFLVEGDSAGGSAKQARDRIYQAIMPLRGKILNTWEVASSEVLASQEVHDIAQAVGVDPGSKDLSGLRYGRVCILADADSDGAHIATLLCALFLRHFPVLVEEGRVCVSLPPLFRVDQGKTVIYAQDEVEKERIISELSQNRGKINVQRFKGLGEMNPAQLRETTMAPETRRLVQLTVEDAALSHDLMDMLLNKKRVADRKGWLGEKGDQMSIGLA